jgi:hypothetical protein
VQKIGVAFSKMVRHNRDNVVKTFENIMPKGQKGFKKGDKRPAGAGRKPGTPNKFTTAKQAFLDAFEELGGKDFVIEVASTARGREVVLSNLAKLLPNKQELSGPDGGPIKAEIKVKVNLVRPGNK